MGWFNHQPEILIRPAISRKGGGIRGGAALDFPWWSSHRGQFYNYYYYYYQQEIIKPIISKKTRSKFLTKMVTLQGKDWVTLNCQKWNEEENVSPKQQIPQNSGATHIHSLLLFVFLFTPSSLWLKNIDN